MKRVLRWFGIGVLGALGLALAAYGLASFTWNRHLRRTWAVPAVSLAGLHGNAKRGEYLVAVGNGCVECHGDDLAGGTVVEDPVAGKIYGPNITPAALKDWSDGEIARAIHHGVGKEGRSLFIMPSDAYQYLCREDVADMVAYLRSVKPVDRKNRTSRVGPVIKVMWALGKITNVLPAEVVDHRAPFVKQVAERPTRAYGAYLYKSHCAGCHREDGRGGKVPSGPPNWPPAANLTKDGAGGWTRAGFIRTFRTGINPSGSAVQPPMGDAIRKFGKKMSETELRALWEHLRTLEGVSL